MVDTPSFLQFNLCIQPTVNLHQKSVYLLQSIFTSLLHPYLFTKSSLQSRPTALSSIPWQFLTSLFLTVIVPTICTKNISLPQPFSQFRLREGNRESCRESCEDWHCFNLSLLPQSMDSDISHTITNSLLLRLRELVCCRCGLLSYPTPIAITSVPY